MAVQIIQGSNKSFVVRLKSAASGDPLPLGSVTEITTCFKTDGDEYMASLTGGQIVVTDGPLGKMRVDLPATATATFSEVTDETLEIALDFGQGPEKVQIPKSYSVIESIC